MHELFEGYWYIEELGCNEEAGGRYEEKRGREVEKRDKLKIFVINGHGGGHHKLVPTKKPSEFDYESVGLRQLHAFLCLAEP